MINFCSAFTIGNFEFRSFDFVWFLKKEYFPKFYKFKSTVINKSSLHTCRLNRPINFSVFVRGLHNLKDYFNEYSKFDQRKKQKNIARDYSEQWCLSRVPTIE